MRVLGQVVVVVPDEAGVERRAVGGECQRDQQPCQELPIGGERLHSDHSTSAGMSIQPPRRGVSRQKARLIGLPVSWQRGRDRSFPIA